MRASSELSLHTHQNFVEFAQERLVFCLFYQKLELFLVRPLRTKFGKILAVDQKDQRDRYVWVGQALPKETNVYLRKIVAQYCLQKRFISVNTVVWLHVRSENEPKKIGQCRIFWGCFRPTRTALVRPPPVDEV